MSRPPREHQSTSVDNSRELAEADDAHALRLGGAPWTGIGWSLALPCEVTSTQPPCSCRLKVGHGGLHEGQADVGGVVRWP
jgi:hypothetical protein